MDFKKVFLKDWKGNNVFAAREVEQHIVAHTVSFRSGSPAQALPGVCCHFYSSGQSLYFSSRQCTGKSYGNERVGAILQLSCNSRRFFCTFYELVWIFKSFIACVEAITSGEKILVCGPVIRPVIIKCIFQLGSCIERIKLQSVKHFICAKEYTNTRISKH